MADDLDSLAARLNALLPGSSLAHGEYDRPVVGADGKAEIKDRARTVRTPATAEHWLRHLRGERGLGLIPLEDDMATWIMIDVDQPRSGPPLSLSEVAHACAAVDPRIVVLRTKSGGAHPLVLLTEPIPADRARTLGLAIGRRAGLLVDDVYPRQVEVGRDGTGNWITMPYWDCNADGVSQQPALTNKGHAMTLPQAVRHMEHSRLPPADVSELEAKVATLAPEGGDDTCTDADRTDARALLTKLADEMAAMTANRNVALNTRAFQMGVWVEVGALAQETVERELGDAARRAGLPDSEVREVLRRAITDGRRKGVRPSGQRTLVLNPNDPRRAAQRMLAECFTDAKGQRELVRWRETFWLHDRHHRDAGREAVRARVWRWLGEQLERGSGGKLVPYLPNKQRVANVEEALAALTIMDNHVEPPTWLAGDDGHPPANEILAVKNGLLHLPTGRLLPHTPAYFCLSATDVEYDPDAPPPERWLAFLGQILDSDDDSIATLQDWLGYVLSPDTSQQKILLIVGPPRSGKGTIARVATGLVGRESCAAPTLASLGTNFGLQPLIGRPLAIIADARMGGRTDVVATGERLLAVSGEDSITVDRKHKEAWTGRLPTRFMLMTTEIPEFSDASGGLARRFVVLQLQTSFLGREDPALTSALLAELPGILRWALVGYRRLRDRGHFVQPVSAGDTVADLVRMSSPISAFVEERCIVGPGLEVHTDAIWEAWQQWCEDSGRQDAGTKQGFGGHLKAVPGIRRVERERWEGGKRTGRWYAYEGIRLRPPVPDAREERGREDGQQGLPWRRP